MKIAITGATGFVGGALQNVFSEVVIINRKDDQAAILAKLEGVEVVINLAGAPIIKRWSPAYKKMLLRSRVDTTTKLVNAINESRVAHFIQASATGIYPNDTPCDETTQEYAQDFLGGVVAAWEKAASACIKPTTILRFGVVLHPSGGALQKMLLPFKLGVGGTIGDGTMMSSWVALEDLVRLFLWVVDTRKTGIFNATAPHPVTNVHFTKSLAHALHRKAFLPLPKWVLRGVFGEAACVLTDSKEVYPQALIEAGFEFEYPTIEAAFSHYFNKLISAHP